MRTMRRAIGCQPGRGRYVSGDRARDPDHIRQPDRPTRSALMVLAPPPRPSRRWAFETIPQLGCPTTSQPSRLRPTPGARSGTSEFPQNKFWNESNPEYGGSTGNPPSRLSRLIRDARAPVPLTGCFPVLRARHAPLASDARSGVGPSQDERPAITLMGSSLRFPATGRGGWQWRRADSFKATTGKTVGMLAREAVT
jgi:hypothetical protein